MSSFDKLFTGLFGAIGDFGPDLATSFRNSSKFFGKISPVSSILIFIFVLSKHAHLISTSIMKGIGFFMSYIGKGVEASAKRSQDLKQLEKTLIEDKNEHFAIANEANIARAEQQQYEREFQPPKQGALSRVRNKIQNMRNKNRGFDELQETETTTPPPGIEGPYKPESKGWFSSLFSRKPDPSQKYTSIVPEDERGLIREDLNEQSEKVKELNKKVKSARGPPKLKDVYSENNVNGFSSGISGSQAAKELQQIKEKGTKPLSQSEVYDAYDEPITTRGIDLSVDDESPSQADFDNFGNDFSVDSYGDEDDIFLSDEFNQGPEDANFQSGGAAIRRRLRNIKRKYRQQRGGADSRQRTRELASQLDSFAGVDNRITPEPEPIRIIERRPLIQDPPSRTIITKDGSVYDAEKFKQAHIAKLGKHGYIELEIKRLEKLNSFNRGHWIIHLLILLFVFYIDYAIICESNDETKGKLDYMEMFRQGVFTIVPLYGFLWSIQRIRYYRNFRHAIDNYTTEYIGDILEGLVLFYMYNLTMNFREINGYNNCYPRTAESVETKDKESFGNLKETEKNIILENQQMLDESNGLQTIDDDLIQDTQEALNSQDIIIGKTDIFNALAKIASKKLPLTVDNVKEELGITKPFEIQTQEEKEREMVGKALLNKSSISIALNQDAMNKEDTPVIAYFDETS